MSTLSVDPEDLEDLAKKIDVAAEEAAAAATVHHGMTTNVWVTHGVMSGPSNQMLEAIVDIREAAGMAIAKAADDLAKKLRTAKEMYEGVDQDAAINIASQVISS